MEGRHPPPKAEHPYTNEPDLSRIYGTPLMRVILKSFGVFLLTYGTYLGINMYLTRHQRGPFGTDIMSTREEIEKGLMIREFGLEARMMNIPIRQKARDLDIILKPSEGRVLQFDDGVSFKSAS